MADICWLSIYIFYVIVSHSIFVHFLITNQNNYFVIVGFQDARISPLITPKDNRARLSVGTRNRFKTSKF